MPNTMTPELQKEVQTVLSMRLPSDNVQARQKSSQLLQKLAPGTPQAIQQQSKQEQHLIIQSSSDINLNDIAVDELGHRALEKPSVSDRSSNVGRAWVADAAEEHTGRRSRWHRMREALMSFQHVLKAHPYILVVSLLTAAVLATAGVVGVLAAANTETRHRKDSAQGMADNAAVAFQVQLQQVFSPLAAMSALIHFQPNYTLLAPRYNELAQELLSQLPVPGSIASLQMSPQGVVRSFYPLAGNEAAMGHNLFKDPQRRAAALETIMRNELTMQGPVTLLQGFRGAVGRVPVFIANVSEDEWFGAPDRAYDCDICYNATTRTKFWGFVSCIVKLQDLATGKDTRLLKLADMGYSYEFFAPQPDSEPIMIAASAHSPLDPVIAIVDVPNNRWSLLVAPEQGWVPTWRDPMLAAVVIVSFLIGLLVMATLVSRQLQLWLLKEMKVSNRALAAEKERTDVLLARQYNLISLMAQQGSVRDGHASSLEEKTLDQIESMRRQIGAASFSAGGDQLQLLELLGEGTFGKVHKGIWRGSIVAIKTMILPAKMSGAEKRERMAIMEAAISSIMNHPNIVQTYTYTIKPATSTTAKSHPSDQATSEARLGSHPGGSAAPQGSQASGVSQGFEADSSNVHSFEVNIVLEYCDRGCLRDALDAGAFYTQGSLNYSAVLDTAADVAKAMLHLHCNQVLHSDLKVRNVLLKSDGSSERGCIAKVADFGLAVKMENQDTHVSAFQGTMSHMAPEAMLRGHISKAADVYSYGITLWELFTGGHAYHGIPKALLGHQVAVGGLRPAFPHFTPTEYRQLAESCWHTEPDKRPSFAEILGTLQRMRTRVGGHTPPMPAFQPLPSVLRQRMPDEFQQQAASATTPSSSLERARQIAAAQDGGALQLASFYVDMGSSVMQADHASGNDVHHSISSNGSTDMLQAHQQHVSAAAPGYCRLSKDNNSGTQLSPIFDTNEECDDVTAAETNSAPTTAAAAAAVSMPSYGSSTGSRPDDVVQHSNAAV